MRKALLLLLLFTFTATAYAENYLPMERAESFFTLLKHRQYGQATQMLTAKSRMAIENAVMKNIKKANIPFSAKELTDDFDRCGEICVIYWDNLLKHLSTDLILEQSRWTLGKSTDTYYEIISAAPGAVYPAVIKMYLEKGQWQMGFAETFWSR